MKARRLLSFVALLLLLAGCARPGERLGVLWDAPPFTLTDQAGQPFNSNALAGRVWLVDFIYTTCPDVCPIYLSPKMADLQRRIVADNLVGKAELISISVDPAHDTPPVLTEYGARYGADARVWRFLTGPESTLHDLLQAGFKVGSAVQADTETVAAPQATDAGVTHSSHATPAAGGGYTVVHSSYFLLVDRQGKIRALYDGTEVEATTMYADMRQLVSAP